MPRKFENDDGFRISYISRVKFFYPLTSPNIYIYAEPERNVSNLFTKKKEDVSDKKFKGT